MKFFFLLPEIKNGYVFKYTQNLHIYIYVYISIMYIHMYRYIHVPRLNHIERFCLPFWVRFFEVGFPIDCQDLHHSKYCVAPWFVVVGLDSSGSKKDSIQKTGLKVLVESLSFFFWDPGMRSWPIFFPSALLPTKSTKFGTWGLELGWGSEQFHTQESGFLVSVSSAYSYRYCIRLYYVILYTYVLCIRIHIYIYLYIFFIEIQTYYAGILYMHVLYVYISIYLYVYVYIYVCMYVLCA